MRKILLTRLAEDNAEDKRYFQQKHYECIEIPLLRLKMRTIEAKQIKKIIEADWIFLTSQHSAAFFLELLTNWDLFSVVQLKCFAVIGEKTAAVLKNAGIVPAFQAEVQTKQHMFKQWLAAHSKESVRIVYPKSNLADHLGEELLRNEGHRLFTFLLYENTFPEENCQQLKACLDEPELTAVYFASPSLWTRFYRVYREAAFRKPLQFYCVGRMTQLAIEKDGCKAEIK